MYPYGSTHIESLTDALMELNTSDELGKLARLTGSRAPTRKAELADHIAGYLAGDGLRKAYGSLGELERAAVAEVVHSDSDTLEAERFLAKYGAPPRQEPKDPYSYRRQPTLLDMFLIGRNRLMPREIKRRLKELVPPPAAVTVRTIDSPPESYRCRSSSRAPDPEAVPVRVHLSEQRAQRELLAVLRLIDSQRVAVGSKTLRPSQAAIGAISAVLDGEDFYRNDQPARKYYDPNPGAIRAFAWPMILQAAELVRLSGNRLQLTSEGRNAMSSLSGEVIRRVWDRWVYADLDELSRIECVKGQTGKGGRSLTATFERRDSIQVALASCPADAWIEIDELVRFMRASGFDARVTDNAWELYIGHREYGSLGYSGGAEALDRAYLRAFLLEYAATMGLIDVALIPPVDAVQETDHLWGADDLPYFSRYDGLVAIRINPLGAYCLGTSSLYTSPMFEAARYLRVLPNREIVATTARISMADRLALDQYFEPEADLVWRIESEKLLSVVENNGTIEQVREYLLAHSETSVPQTVTQLLDDVAERSRGLNAVGTARLIECADETLASLIAHDSLTRRHCMLAGSRHLVVPQRSESAFKRGLKKLGYVVRWTADAPDT